jgi:sugar O-acyltransferase (sialic acid O-acetyltransferase NeuD family)
MLIVGARGFAKEVLEVLHQLDKINDVVFYDDINLDATAMLYDNFPILKNIDEVKYYFKSISKRFTIGVGNPLTRKIICDKFTEAGGVFTSVISPFAHIGNYNNKIEDGCNIMTGSVITSDILIGKGVLINLNCTVGHDSVIGDFVEMSPGVHVSGNCKIGSFCNIGTNASILPKVTLGQNVIVGAGSVVTKNVPDNCLVVGIPALIKKEIPRIQF